MNKSIEKKPVIPVLGEMEEDEEKAVGQFKLALNLVLKPLRLYGQNHYVDTATEEIVSLAIELHQRLEGIDEPYHINADKLVY